MACMWYEPDGGSCGPDSTYIAQLSPLAVLIARSQRRLFTTGYSTRTLLFAMGFMVPVMFGSGNQLVLCMILLVETVEHILRNQFHGRRKLAGQDCVLLVECADLLCELVDDLIRVGWNLLSQNVSLNAKPPQSDWIAGVEKNGEKRGQSAAVIVSMRVTALSPSSVKVRPRFVFTSVKVTDVPESSNVASTPRW